MTEILRPPWWQNPGGESPVGLFRRGRAAGNGELAEQQRESEARLKAARAHRDTERRKLREEHQSLVVPIREELKSNHFAQLASDAFRHAR